MGPGPIFQKIGPNATRAKGQENQTKLDFVFDTSLKCLS